MWPKVAEHRACRGFLFTSGMSRLRFQQVMQDSLLSSASISCFCNDVPAVRLQCGMQRFCSVRNIACGSGDYLKESEVWCWDSLPAVMSVSSSNTFSGGPSTQYLRFLVPKTILLMVFGTRVLKYWVLGRPEVCILPHSIFLSPPATELGDLPKLGVCRGSGKLLQGLHSLS